MANSFPNFPKTGDKIVFKNSWQFQNEWGGYEYINNGQFGEVLEAKVVDGNNYDTATGYLLFIGVLLNGKLHVLKFPYTDRPEVIEVVPNTPAAQVLFGRR